MKKPASTKFTALLHAELLHRPFVETHQLLLFHDPPIELFSKDEQILLVSHNSAGCARVSSRSRERFELVHDGLARGSWRPTSLCHFLYKSNGTIPTDNDVFGVHQPFNASIDWNLKRQASERHFAMRQD